MATYTVDETNDTLKIVDDAGVTKYIGIDLSNKDYYEFLEWREGEGSPPSIPGSWPTLPE